MRISTLTQLGLELNDLAWSGKLTITKGDVIAAIAGRTIFEVLEGLPITVLEREERDELLEEWTGLANAYAFREIRDGLTLLVTYILLGIQHRRSDFLIDEEQRRALQRIEGRDGVPAAEQVRQALAEWLARNGSGVAEHLIKITPQDIERCWGYYKHADDLQHRRHQLFVTVELALVVGFVGLPDSAVDLRLVLAAAGSGLVFLWLAVVHTVERGMEDLNKALSDVDEIYMSYLRRVRPAFGLFSGKWVLNRLLPLVVLAMWICLFYAWVL